MRREDPTVDLIVIAPEGRAWIVKHNGSVLGHASGREEASRIAQALIDWLQDQGRQGDLQIVNDAGGTLAP